MPDNSRMIVSPRRHRLPNRRSSVTQDIVLGNMSLTASVGFDSEGRPREIFLSGAKDGSGLAAILEEDASVVISVALQHGIRATALAKSIARIPENLDALADWGAREFHLDLRRPLVLAKVAKI